MPTVRASAYLEDYEWAVRVGGLYTLKTEVVNTEESTDIQVPQFSGCIAADEAPEPGPRPQVSGSARANPIRSPLAPSTRPMRRRVTLKEYQNMK